MNKKLEFKNALVDVYDLINNLNTKLFVLDTSLLEVEDSAEEQKEFETAINSLKKILNIYD